MDSLVRTVAFRFLLGSGQPVAVEELARATAQDPARVSQVIEALCQTGRLRMDAEGNVTGAAGLSAKPDRHEIEIEGRRFWTWCAYDILGIFGALQADGIARSTNPADGTMIELRFASGRPEPTRAVLFRPDGSLATSCENVYEEWCPNSNLFAEEAAALAWADARGLVGTVLSLGQASEEAAAEWRPLTAGLTPDR